MNSHAKALLGALALVLALGMLGGQAAALRSLSVNQTTIEGGGSVTFTDSGGTFRVVCTVLGTLTVSPTVAKRAGALVGGITAARVERCSGGNVRILGPEARRPFPIHYVSFSGTLPNITEFNGEVDFTSGGFLVEVFFGIARCLYSGRGSGILRGSNPVREVVLNQTAGPEVIRQELSQVECPTGRFAGTLLPLRGSERVVITLI